MEQRNTDQWCECRSTHTTKIVGISWPQSAFSSVARGFVLATLGPSLRSSLRSSLFPPTACLVASRAAPQGFGGGAFGSCGLRSTPLCICPRFCGVRKSVLFLVCGWRSLFFFSFFLMFCHGCDKTTKKFKKGERE